MQTLHLDHQPDHQDALDAAAAALQAGQVIVLPTDTVYGLAALPGDADAVRRVYLAKGRPGGLPLPVLAGSLEQVRQLGVEYSAPARALASRWWPGPLTMAFGFSPTAARPPWLTGREEVAVRIPRHAFLLALLPITGVLLVTSANPHGSVTAPTAEEAASYLAPHVSLIVDGGVLDSTPSTLVNVRAGGAVVEREGAITTADIAAALAEANGAP
jgi:L-threonylcarbamoyladenylate synthase